MNDFEATLTTSFCCAKCHGKTAVTKTVSFGGLSGLLTMSAERYVLLTCTLCGYTEMYSPLAFAQSEEAAREAKKLAQET